MTDFTDVYNKYFRDVYRYALALTKNESLAEELTQETFFKALKSIEQFDGRCRLYVWLCQIAKNTYFTMYRKEIRQQQELELQDSFSFEDKLLNKETAFDIHKVLHRLEEPYKEVFYMRTYGEMSFKDIGMIFKRQETWARVTYYRARKKIMEVMENEDNL